MPEATRNRCYFYNSFFYKKLSEKQPGLPAVNATGRCEAAKAAHERVRKWTKVSTHCPAWQPEARTLLPPAPAMPHYFMMHQHLKAPEASVWHKACAI